MKAIFWGGSYDGVEQNIEPIPDDVSYVKIGNECFSINRISTDNVQLEYKENLELKPGEIVRAYNLNVSGGTP